MVARTYLDWNASAPLRVEARAALSAALALTGNPSSVHHEGRAARQMVEEARGAVAALVGAEARNVIFTAGGTEANALRLAGNRREYHLRRGNGEVFAMMFADADEVDAQFVGEHRFLHEIANHLGMRHTRAVSGARYVAEGVEAELEL